MSQNPVSNNIQLLTDLSFQFANVELIDVSGRILSTKRLIPDDMQLDVSNFLAGLYFLRIVTEEDNTVIRVVKE